MGAGFAPQALIERLYINARRVCPYLTTLRRFWVNVQCAIPVTRKPENVRMGKGKGGRSGMQARITPGLTLVAFSAIRPGTLRAITRRMRVRCRFVIAAFRAEQPYSVFQDFCGTPATWIRFRRVQPRYVTAQFSEFRETLRRLRRPALLGYFVRMFW